MPGCLGGRSIGGQILSTCSGGLGICKAFLGLPEDRDADFRVHTCLKKLCRWLLPTWTTMHLLQVPFQASFMSQVVVSTTPSMLACSRRRDRRSESFRKRRSAKPPVCVMCMSERAVENMRVVHFLACWQTRWKIYDRRCASA